MFLCLFRVVVCGENKKCDEFDVCFFLFGCFKKTFNRKKKIIIVFVVLLPFHTLCRGCDWHEIFENTFFFFVFAWSRSFSANNTHVQLQCMQKP